MLGPQGLDPAQKCPVTGIEINDAIEALNPSPPLVGGTDGAEVLPNQP